MPAVLQVAAAVFTVVAGTVALVTIAASSQWTSRVLVRRVLLAARYRAVSRTIAEGTDCSQATVRHRTRTLVDDILQGKPYSVAVELEWLSDLLSEDTPATMILDDASDRRELLKALSDSYEEMAAAWQTQLLAGSRRSEVVAQAARVAEQTADQLRVHSANHVVLDGFDDTLIDLRSRGHFARVLYSDQALDVAVSPYPGRLPSSTSHLRQGPGRPDFEGILPHLLHQQLEIDGESGRLRLHLAIGEMPFSQLRARNREWDKSRVPWSQRTHAVSLAFLPVSLDGYALLARRSPTAGSYPGMIGPYVTGNAELRDRHGLRADRDLLGLPDLLQATCREAREEAGLELRPQELAVLGLAQIWSSEDTAIWSLMTTAPLDITADEAGQLVRKGDPVEGTWEVGHELYGIGPVVSAPTAEEVMTWAASADLVPQGVACLYALFRKRGLQMHVDWAAAARSETHPDPSWFRPVDARLPFT